MYLYFPCVQHLIDILQKDIPLRTKELSVKVYDDGDRSRYCRKIYL